MVGLHNRRLCRNSSSSVHSVVVDSGRATCTLDSTFVTVSVAASQLDRMSYAGFRPVMTML
ncbi:hypothetical protein ASG12_13690 [Williamsia sp. Leaf354]|nr:hypothetical protein ASG12_13690 [Williamsia sp. Leaf354]